MATPSTSRSASSGIKIALLAGCLVIGITLLGLSTNAHDGESRNLGSTGIPVSLACRHLTLCVLIKMINRFSPSSQI